MPQDFPPYSWLEGDKIYITYYLQLASQPGMKCISKTIRLILTSTHPYLFVDDSNQEWKLQIGYCHDAVIIDPNGKKYFVDSRVFNRDGINAIYTGNCCEK